MGTKARDSRPGPGIEAWWVGWGVAGRRRVGERCCSRRARCARSARSGEPATPRSHRPHCAGSAALKHLNSGSYRWVCPANPPSTMRVPISEPSSPSCTPSAPPRLNGGHFGHFACAAGGTKCYIGVLGTSCGTHARLARRRVAGGQGALAGRGCLDRGRHALRGPGARAPPSRDTRSTTL